MNPVILSSRLARPGFETTRTGRRLSVAGAAYVSAWVAGLVTAPATPAATAPASAIHRYYLDHPIGILTQSALIHGVAGLALLVLAATLPSATGCTPALRRAVVASGVLAAVLSFTQVALAVVAVRGAGEDAASTSAALFGAINLTDTAKLVVLAAFTGTATAAAARAGMAPRWLRSMTAALVVLLPLGGAAFLVDQVVLRSCLYASLPLLLVWAGCTAFVVGRRAR